MSKRIGDLSEQYDLKNWPHLFTKDGNTFQIGETEEGPVFAVPMICIHCHATYVNGQTPRPADPCPARTKQKEMKRLFN